MKNTMELMNLLVGVVQTNNTIITQNKELNLQNYKIIKHLTYQKTKDTNKFDIATQPKACKILNCSIPTLKKAISNNILIENIHYRYNGYGKYYFSKIALEKIKGTI